MRCRLRDSNYMPGVLDHGATPPPCEFVAAEHAVGPPEITAQADRRLRADCPPLRGPATTAPEHAFTDPAHYSFSRCRMEHPAERDTQRATSRADRELVLPSLHSADSQPDIVARRLTK